MMGLRKGTRLLRALLAAASLAALSLPSAFAAPGRWALVIGNDAYAKVEPLRNAIADANLIAGELRRAGFDVAAIRNADRRTMLREVIELARRAEAGGEALVYFAGHGVQIANTNYLLPVDFDGADEAMLPFEAVSLNDIGNQLLDAKTRFSLLIIDACRNNPLPGRRGRNLRTGPGLAPMSPATGQMVVYAAGSGQVALDGLGDRDPSRNGVFAREFAREMRTPGIDVREMMLTVRESVERLAASVNHAQRPAIYDESRGRFVFHEAASATASAPPASKPPASTTPESAAPAAPQPPAGIAAAAPQAPPAGAARGKSAEQIEDELWTTFSSSNSRTGYAAYLREYPNGRYAAAARVQLEVLGQVDRPAPPPAAVPPPAAAEPRAAEAPVATAKASPAAPVVGRRYRGMDGQFDLTVEAQNGALAVKVFRMTTGRFSGTELRCGAFSNTIDLDEQYNVSAWCSGAIPGSLRLRGRFPRIDIYSGGAFGGGTIDLVEVKESR